MTARERRVLVTIEGTAREMLRPGLPDMLRVRPEGSPVTVLVDPDAPGVTVETIAPPRVWTDGDVVQEADTDRVWRRVLREDGCHRWTNGFLALRTDGVVDDMLARGQVRVLRYQAGESA